MLSWHARTSGMVSFDDVGSELTKSRAAQQRELKIGCTESVARIAQWARANAVTPDASHFTESRNESLIERSLSSL